MAAFALAEGIAFTNIGGIFFYPKVMQERTIELGLITREELKQRKIYAFVLLITLMLVIPLFSSSL